MLARMQQSHNMYIIQGGQKYTIALLTDSNAMLDS